MLLWLLRRKNDEHQQQRRRQLPLGVIDKSIAKISTLEGMQCQEAGLSRIYHNRPFLRISRVQPACRLRPKEASTDPPSSSPLSKSNCQWQRSGQRHHRRLPQWSSRNARSLSSFPQENPPLIRVRRRQSAAHWPRCINGGLSCTPQHTNKNMCRSTKVLQCLFALCHRHLTWTHTEMHSKKNHAEKYGTLALVTFFPVSAFATAVSLRLTCACV